MAVSASPSDTIVTILSLVALVAARWVFFKGTIPVFRRIFAHRHQEEAQMNGSILKLQDELWATFGGVALLVYSLYVLHVGNPADCQLSNTWGCFKGWPDEQEMPHITHVYLLVELGWYIHFVPKHHLGIGLKDDLPMHVHHFATITLVSISHSLKLHQIGVLLLALLNASNPVLHAAKVAHILNIRLLDKVVFVLFALVFLVTRVVMYPAIILRCTLFRALAVAPAFLSQRSYFLAWSVSNVCLLGLMALQLLWMRNIFRLFFKLTSNADSFKTQVMASDHVVHAHVVHAQAESVKQKSS